MDSTATLKRQYLDLRRQGIELAENGHYQDAEPLLAEAYRLARDIPEPGVVDRAFCNMAAVQVELTPSDELLPRLRNILVRNADLDACRLAAYHLARAYERRKDHKKGLFYARIAFERTRSLDQPHDEWLASSHNQIGNFLAAESFFSEAIAEYRRALALHPQGDATRCALIERNIGYCQIMLGQPERGLRTLYSTFRVLRPIPRLEMLARLDLSLGHIEIGRYRHALRHGLKALTIADRLGAHDERKNALYLVGEAANLAGDEELARRHFERLQEHFPDAPFLPDLLLATDVRQLINLRA